MIGLDSRETSGEERRGNSVKKFVVGALVSTRVVHSPRPGTFHHRRSPLDEKKTLIKIRLWIISRRSREREREFKSNSLGCLDLFPISHIYILETEKMLRSFSLSLLRFSPPPPPPLPISSFIDLQIHSHRFIRSF